MQKRCLGIRRCYGFCIWLYPSTSGLLGTEVNLEAARPVRENAKLVQDNLSNADKD